MKQIWALVLLCATFPALAELPVGEFSRIDGFDNAQISPDGKYVAFTTPVGDGTGLAVIDLGTRKLVGKMSIGALRSSARSSVARFYWAGPRRLVATLSDDFAMFDSPLLTGEIIAFDADGGGAKYLFGYRGSTGGAPVGSNIPSVAQNANAYGEVIRTLPDDPEHVLINTYNWYSMGRDGMHAIVYRLSTTNGQRDQSVGAPISGEVNFAADDKGFVRFAVGHDEHEHLRTFVRSPEQPEWKPLGTTVQDNTELWPLAFAKSGDSVFASSDEGGDRQCLVRLDLKSGTRTALDCDAVADLSDVVMSFDQEEPVAAIYKTANSMVHLLGTPNPARSMLEKLQAAFPGQIALPVSQTRDGKTTVVLVYSDRNPGDYYLFDTQTLHADYLIGRNGWIDPAKMAQRKPITFTARDGTTLHGFLTLPNGVPPKKLPMVVHPHGGPFDVHDDWAWDATSQALASGGYAVLEINFRGSSGYGDAFASAGKQGWERVMIDDITDGVHWAVAQDVADAGRLCIYGASYGGYAAMMSAVREPDLYRCVVAYAGVYNLESFVNSTDVSRTRQGRNFIEDFIGATPDKLRGASPLFLLNRLKAAVMIVHGKLDERAPYSQAEELRSALDQRKYPYEWLVKSKEGHGFSGADSRRELFEKAQAFINRNIGVAPGPVTAAAPVMENH